MLSIDCEGIDEFMLLDTINQPADLRSLTYGQLDQLSAEIREFIVDSFNSNGGHLGSNLGAVELSVALHRIFDSPKDVVLWDTGHQSYVHKLLTGRRDDFPTLRKAGGLSGYPSREESEHDWVENSHASTILSYAHGLATANENPASGFSENGERRIVAVIGDGSMTGGMAFEGLNNLGHSGKKAIIILNDNGRSYAPTVSRLGNSLKRIRLNPAYLRQQAKVERAIQDVPVVGNRLERGFGATKAAIREMWEPRAFFEDLGVRYAGPFDGHDIATLERALQHATAYDGPIVLHVLTQKGRGYAPAENDPIKNMHDAGQYKPGSYTAAFSESLIKAAEEHPEIVAITAAMPDSTGLLSFEERFPGRLIDVGIAEQHAVTAAAGMAMGGLLPVVALYSTFLTRAFDQANLDVGLHGQKVIYCLDRAGITGDDGASHHGVLDMVLLSKVPGMTIFTPSSYQELQQNISDAVELCDGPVSIRFPKTAAVNVPDEEVGRGFEARKVRQGTDVAIIAVGKLLAAAQEAAELLAAEGIEATIWDPRVIKPLDPAMIADAATHPLVVTAEDGLAIGGAGSAIASSITECCVGGDSVPPVQVLGIPDQFLAHGNADAILSTLGLDGPGLADTVRSWRTRS